MPPTQGLLSPSPQFSLSSHLGLCRGPFRDSLTSRNPVEWLKKPSETAVARPLALVDLASTSGFLAGTEAGLLGVFLVAVPDLDFHRFLLLRLMVRGTSG